SRITPTVPPRTIALVDCPIKSFQRASRLEKPWPGGEKRRDGQASYHKAWEGDGVVAPPVCAPGLCLIARERLIGATPRGQPWTSAVTRPQGCNGLRAWRMAGLWTFREPSLGRHMHRELLRRAVHDLTPILPTTACYQRIYVERYSRCRCLCDL